MRTSVLLLLLGWTAPAAAQVQPGDLLLNSFSPTLLVHLRADGTVVQTTSGGTGNSWEGAGILPDGTWFTTRRSPVGINLFDPLTGAQSGGFDMPAGFSGIAGDVGSFSDGTLAVVDQNGAVWRFDSNGAVIDSWSTGGHPFGIFIDAQDHVWTCDIVGRVLRHTDDEGKLILEFPTGSDPGDVVMAADGTLFLTHRSLGEVAHYAQDGTLLGTFQATTQGSSEAIAMAPDGTLWVSSESETKILHYDQGGTLLGSIDVGPATWPLFMTIPATFGDGIGTNYCGPANFNSTGLSAMISAFGSTSASSNFVTLTAVQLPPDVFGYFLNSDVKAFKPFPPGSHGNLCLGGGIGRHAKQILNSGAAGELVIDLDLGALPRPNAPHSVVAGETWNFQCWFRDKQPDPTSNFTDGIEIVFE